MNEFLDKLKNLWELKAAVEELKAAEAAASKKLEEAKRDVLKAMEVLELDKQHVPGHGTVYRQKNFSVKTPKDPDSKGALYDWIAQHKGKDVLDNMLSINSQTLNSFYKSELAAAVEAGESDFSIPGLGTPEVYYTVGMRKG